MCQTIFLPHTHLIIPTNNTTKINRGDNIQGIQVGSLPLVAQLVKNLPAMWETQVRSLAWEDPLEIPWRRERLLSPVFWPREFHGLYSSWGRKEWDMTEQMSLHF